MPELNYATKGMKNYDSVSVSVYIRHMVHFWHLNDGIRERM